MEPRSLIVPSRWSSTLRTCHDCGETRGLRIDREVWGRLWLAAEVGFAVTGWGVYGRDQHTRDPLHHCAVCLDAALLSLTRADAAQHKSDVTSAVTTRARLARMVVDHG